MAKAKVKETLPPVDLTFLWEWDFVGGTGDYQHQRVCIMSALYLATEIAAGRTTLAIALGKEEPPEDNLETEYPVERITEQDRVSCVSPTLRTLVVQRNDHFDEGRDDADPERKAWALALLPKLLGTDRGPGMEKRLRAVRTKAAAAFEKAQARKLREKEKKDRAEAEAKLHAARLELIAKYEKTRKEDFLRDAYYLELDSFAPDSEYDEDDDDDTGLRLDAEIAAVLAYLEKYK